MLPRLKYNAAPSVIQCYPVWFLCQTLSDLISEAQGWLQAQEDTKGPKRAGKHKFDKFELISVTEKAIHFSFSVIF